MNANRFKLGAATVAVASALTAAYTLGHANAPLSQPASAGVVAAAVAVPAAAPVPAAIPSAAGPDMSGIVARNSPAVVHVSVTTGRRNADARPHDDEDSVPEFFRRFGPPGQQGEAPRRGGLGSGFIVSADGVILTNAHVVEGAEEVTVKLSDRREFRAKVLGADKASDVAVLKIEASGLPAVKVGSAANTRVGEWVLAIGSPFGFESSASAGIVSARSRALPDGGYVPFIQTDVAVNPGNSGGPLFNMAGEVIGINSQIYSRSGGYQGISFAIPIEVAMNIERQVANGGKIERGRIGVGIQEVNQALADSFGLKSPAGALVGSVDKDGPGAKAGLQPGDVILSVDGKPIVASVELPAMVSAMKPGQTARLEVWRGGERRNIDVTVDRFADSKVATADTPELSKGRLGVAVRPLTPEEQRRSDSKGGVLVENVGGAAAKAGIRRGDILVSVNGQSIASPEQLKEMITQAGKQIAVLVERGNARIFVPVELG